MDKTIKIIRFDLSPKNEPSGYIIGFHVEKNSRFFYFESYISFKEVIDMDDEEIANVAWTKIKKSTEKKMNIFLKGKKELLGQIFVPFLEKEGAEK